MIFMHVNRLVITKTLYCKTQDMRALSINKSYECYRLFILMIFLAKTVERQINDFYKRAPSEKQHQALWRIGGLQQLYSHLLVMSGGDRNQWNQGADLQSYAFEDYYDKNESPILDEAGFGIDLSIDHIPFQMEHTQQDTRMETQQSENPSRMSNEAEDYFFLSDDSPVMQFNRHYSDPPRSTPHVEVQEVRQHYKPKCEKKIKKPANPRKNQYDKNIFANINAVILKKLVMPEAEEELRIYCNHHKVNFQQFYSHFSMMERSKFRMGTTQLSNFYQSKEVATGWKQVFGMFSVRFLRYEYSLYMLREGRMQEREKYLSCATKMMYIPSLRKEEYTIISCLMNQVVDI